MPHGRHSRSRSRRRRRRDSRSRTAERRARRKEREAQRQREREEQERRDREREARRERERAEKVPTETVLVQNIPDEGVTEERLEAVAWEVAVQAGCSMPNGVHFAYDRASQQFRGFAVVEFPHKDASRIFMEHTSGVLEVDGVKMTLKFHHAGAAQSRSRSRDRGRDAEPSVTLIIQGIRSSTSESSLVVAFQPYAAIKDVRHFARRGFAFVQFHSIDDASTALSRFKREGRSMVDDYKVDAHFAKEKDSGDRPGYYGKQDEVAAKVTAELENIVHKQVQEANASKALSGVNAEMWASYLNTVTQTEAVESSNTFKLDKESGYYLDAKAGLFYDASTTYFFTTDFKKYFLYDHEVKMLCLVDSNGHKVEGGERRPLPSQRDAGRRGEPLLPRERADRDRDRSGRPRERSLPRRDRSRSGGGLRHRDRDRGRERSRSRERGRHDRESDRGMKSASDMGGGVGGVDSESLHLPIHFPGGDPLAVLAPAQVTSPEQPKAQAKKKKKNEGVLGLVDLAEARNAGGLACPGPVTVFPTTSAATPPAIGRPGPVTVLAAPPATHSSGRASAVSSGRATPVVAMAPPTLPDEWICEICMRKFPTQEQLTKHEEMSELHKQNLARLRAGR